MIIRNDASMLYFFFLWDGRPKPAYRQRQAGLYLISTNFFPVEIYYW